MTGFKMAIYFSLPTLWHDDDSKQVKKVAPQKPGMCALYFCGLLW